MLPFAVTPVAGEKVPVKVADSNWFGEKTAPLEKSPNESVGDKAMFEVPPAVKVTLRTRLEKLRKVETGLRPTDCVVSVTSKP
jgi:hypothetical protein